MTQSAPKWLCFVSRFVFFAFVSTDESEGVRAVRGRERVEVVELDRDTPMPICLFLFFREFVAVFIILRRKIVSRAELDDKKVFFHVNTHRVTSAQGIDGFPIVVDFFFDWGGETFIADRKQEVSSHWLALGLTGYQKNIKKRMKRRNIFRLYCRVNLSLTLYVPSMISSSALEFICSRWSRISSQTTSSFVFFYFGIQTFNESQVLQQSQLKTLSPPVGGP